MRKNLLNKMLKQPLMFDHSDINALLKTYELSNGIYDTGKAFKDLRDCVKSIYDINESQLTSTSNANSGGLGYLNRISTNRRQKEYIKKIESQKSGVNYIRIYAEGDSWFQFPVFVEDVIDWLKKKNNYLIYTDAYAGDWITNIIYEGQYVEALSVHAPDFFLISGGGNDLVGNLRLAVMVSKLANQTPKYSVSAIINNSNLTNEEKDALTRAQPHITKEFYAFINVMKLQYLMLFKNLSKSKHKEMKCITHGYAYPYPKEGANVDFEDPLQSIVNTLLHSGQWLFRPLMIRGITDSVLQRAIAVTLIYEFNEMLIDIAVNHDLDNVYHVDCRKTTTSQEDWYDELHLKSRKFEEVAALYSCLIDNLSNGRQCSKVITKDSLLNSDSCICI